MSDETIQLWGVVGTWFAGIGTLAASVVALWLARRVEKIKLKAHVGLGVTFGNGSSQDCLNFNVTNLGERPVTIVSLGWRIGKRKNRKFAIQPLTQSSFDQYPKKLEYGESASFMVFFSERPNWMEKFSNDFIEDISDKTIKTLRAQIHTSVGHTKDVIPARSLLEKLKKINKMNNS